jgi:hypothetical protein
MPTKRRPINYRLIRDAIPVLWVLERLGWEPQYRRGQKCRGWCPVHSQTGHRSTILAVDGTHWYCHRCRRGGDAIDMYSLVTGEPLYESAVHLCEEFSLDVPYLERPGR